MPDFASNKDSLFFHQISLFEVDAVGYFPISRIFELCHLAWEKQYLPCGCWQDLFLSDAGFPVVSVEGSFPFPFKLGDKIFIEVSCQKISKKSVTFSYSFDSQNKKCFFCHVVHVYIEKGKPSSIPEKWKNIFKKKACLPF